MSCYNLTLEEQTVYAKWERDGKLKQGTEDLQKEQYHLAEELLKSAGYDHYEVSNYALTNYKAIHNSNYWTRQAYEGYGPSAHSYYDRKRSWNIANNAQYIRKLEERVLPAESEQLEDGDFYNELIMLGLRTAKGISKKSLEDLPDIIQLYWEEEVSKYLKDGTIISTQDAFQLHRDAWYISDHVSADLFYTQED